MTTQAPGVGSLGEVGPTPGQTPGATGVEHPAAPGVNGVDLALDESDYHSHPALSSTGARRLLDCPARFRWEQLHGRANTADFDLGHAAHKTVLGVGAPLAVIDAKDWRTKAAQEARDTAYATGEVPLLAKDYQHVQRMASALRRHEIAAELLAPDDGDPEVSLFADDEVTGVQMRARLDWLPRARDDGRLILVDYKTTQNVSPTAISKSMYSYGYHQQAAFYSDIVLRLGLAEHVAFLFVFQEKTAPYLVTVGQPDDLAMQIGRDRNRAAIDLYAHCLSTDTWPGYTDGIAQMSLPPWAVRDYLETIA